MASEKLTARLKNKTWTNPQIKSYKKGHVLRLIRGQDSTVDIAAHYGLDSLGIESRWGRDIPHPSKPALGPTQSPIEWIPGLT